MFILLKNQVYKDVPEVHWRGLRGMPRCQAEQPAPQGRQRRPRNDQLRDTFENAQGRKVK